MVDCSSASKGGAETAPVLGRLEALPTLLLAKCLLSKGFSASELADRFVVCVGRSSSVVPIRFAGTDSERFASQRGSRMGS